jgi:hypothetical protein
MESNLLLFIIDQSGSMKLQTNSVISGVNKTIQEQKKLQNDSDGDISIFFFNTNINEVRNCKLKYVSSITSADYVPAGGTALYDAVGSAINKYSARENVIAVIVTDGLERNSLNFTHKEMTELIAEQTENKGWSFIYLSEDPTATKQGTEMGFTNRNSTCSNTKVQRMQSGQTLGTQSLQTYIHAVQTGSTQVSYDDWQNMNSEINIDL